MASHRSPMTIYFKIRGSVVLLRIALKHTKNLKSDFSQRELTKCVPSGVCCLDSFILDVLKYNGIKQKPHDHLFQNSD